MPDNNYFARYIPLLIQVVVALALAGIMVLLSTLGDLLEIPTPTHDAVIQLASVINRTDYWKTGRGMKDLGLSKFDKQGLKKFLLDGR